MTHILTELALTYNEHLANLDEARQQFESDVRELNAIVADRLADVVGDPVGPHRKCRWRAVTDVSRQREVSWLNWVAATKIRLDLRVPGRKNFKKGAAEMHFEFKFDRDEGRYRFGARFENSNLVNERLDEMLAQVAERRSAEFPGHQHIKSNTTLLLRVDLFEQIDRELAALVDVCMDAVRDMVDLAFPDHDYVSAAPSPMDDDDDDEDVLDPSESEVEQSDDEDF